MRTVRIFFSKTGEAAYISHLDLQRVMSRALRKSGMPVWWSQGFNPHIYMSFALPLPLGVESLCEAVDVKTEDEGDLSVYAEPLSAALPRGIEVSAIAEPVHAAGEIAFAEYRFSYPDADAVQKAVAFYNVQETAMVLRKTKRSEQQTDLKLDVPNLTLATDETDAFLVRLPAGNEKNFSPLLLAGYLEKACGLVSEDAKIVRKNVHTSGGEEFC